MLLLLAFACKDEPEFRPGGSGPKPIPEDSDSATDSEPQSPYCEENMVPVFNSGAEGVAFCIDKYEVWVDGALGNADQGGSWPDGDGSTTGVARRAPGVMPTTNITWYQAVLVCKNAGKSLCSSAQWGDACDGLQGPGGSTYPYGSTWDDQACATTDISGTPRLSGLQETGAATRCESAFGAMDMVGNAWEWTDPNSTVEGKPATNKVGGSWNEGQGSSNCSSAGITAHDPSYEGTVVARCCAAPIPAE